MTLYTRWVIATVGAAVAGYMLTLPIYRHAASLGLGERFTHWNALGSLIELIVYVAVTYWALAPVFPKLRISRYAAFTILPTILVLVLYAMLDADINGSAGTAPPPDAPQPNAMTAILFAAPLLLGLAWGIFSLQWLSLSEAAEGYRPWIQWSLTGMLASIAVSVLVEQVWGGTPFAEMKTAGQQLAAYLSAVAMSSVFGVVSGFGVAQLREKA
jgi:hypothetical protein